MDKLILAAAAALLAIVIAAVNAPPAITKADQIVPMNRLAPAQALAGCAIG